MKKRHFHIILSRVVLLFGSIVLSFLFIEGMLRMTAFYLLSKHRMQLYTSEKDFVIMTLGESTTASDTPYSWPEQVQEILRSRHPDHTIYVVNKAVSGTNTTRILGNVEAQIREIKPDVIITMMGINDERESQFRHTLYIPNESNRGLRIVRLYRIVREYGRLAVRRITDLHIGVDADRVLTKAKDFQLHGDFEESEIYLKRHIQLVTRDALGYMQLGLLYREMERNKEAEYMLLKALKVAVHKEGVYYELGNYYRDNGNIDLGETMYKKALALDPKHGLAYGGLALLYHWYRNDNYAAEIMYTKAIEYSPEIIPNYSEFADIYRARGDWSRAIELYDQALALEPGDTLASRERAITLQMVSGNVAGASTEREQLHVADMQPVTRSNYELLIQIAGKYRTPLVIMGYPLQSVAALRDLANENHHVTVIDNNDNFRSALMKKSYSDLFTDYFGGNFGHATWEGNRLIADRVSEVLDTLR